MEFLHRSMPLGRQEMSDGTVYFHHSDTYNYYAKFFTAIITVRSWCFLHETIKYSLILIIT